MQYTESRAFFEISSGAVLTNSIKGRLLCLKDFCKRLIALPFALFGKAFKTFFRVIGVGLAILCVICTVATSLRAREFFVERVSSLAKDLADWLLLPFALIGYIFRLIVALSVNPNYYFNSFS